MSRYKNLLLRYHVPGDPAFNFLDIMANKYPHPNDVEGMANATLLNNGVNYASYTCENTSRVRITQQGPIGYLSTFDIHLTWITTAPIGDLIKDWRPHCIVTPEGGRMDERNPLFMDFVLPWGNKIRETTPFPPVPKDPWSGFWLNGADWSAL